MLFSMTNQDSNIFQNKKINYNLKAKNYSKNVNSEKRILNKENSVTVIAKGKKGEEIKILDDLILQIKYL